MKKSSEARAAKARAQALGAAIRCHRGEMTQTGLAIRLGVSQSAISQWETGVIQVTCEHIAKIERVLAVRTGTLLVEAGFLDESLLGLDAGRRYAIWKLQEAVALLAHQETSPDLEERIEGSPRPAGLADGTKPVGAKKSSTSRDQAILVDHSAEPIRALESCRVDIPRFRRGYVLRPRW